MEKVSASSANAFARCGFSFGLPNTVEEVDAFLPVLAGAVAALLATPSARVVAAR